MRAHHLSRAQRCGSCPKKYFQFVSRTKLRPDLFTIRFRSVDAVQNSVGLHAIYEVFSTALCGTLSHPRARILQTLYYRNPNGISIN
jgi:hypothetical protein